MSRIHILIAATCAWFALATSTSACAADKPAQPHTQQQQEKAWRAIAKLPDFWQGTWQSIGAIADDFPIPPDYTPAALEQIRNFKPTEDSPFANCTPLGLPFAQSIGGMPMKFFQSPGMIALYIESSGMTRFIHMDGRAHSEHPNPSYLGESIGHWERDTLVVDTSGFVDGTLFQIGRDRRALLQGDPNPMAGVIFGKHGPDMHLVERMRLLDFKTLEIQTTIHDATIFAKPYPLPARKFLRGIERRNDPQEWACTDNRDFLDPETGKLELNVKSKAQSR
jgi:hypothetical protein